MIETQVEAQVEADGRVKVISFTWHGQQMRVVSQGRQWDQAGRKHVLVMSEGQLAFELAWQTGSWNWVIVREPERKLQA